MVNEMLSYSFMQKAIIGSVLISLVCSILGVFVVLRKQSFFADGIAHASLLGVSVGILLGGNELVFAGLAGILMSGVVTFLQNKYKVSSDSGIGIVYATMFALAVTLIGLKKGYQNDLFSYLFGSILSISNFEIVVASVVLCLVIFFLFLFYNKIVYMSFDREASIVRGVKVELLDYFLNALIAVVVIVSIKLVGIVLTTSLLILPSVLAKKVANRFSHMIPIAIIFSILTTLSALIISYQLDLPSGSFIVLFQAIILALIFLLSKIFKF